MNVEPNQTCINAPDNSAGNVSYVQAVPAASSEGLLILPTDNQPSSDQGPSATSRFFPASKSQGKFYGMTLAWWGLRVMGWALVPAGVGYWGYDWFTGKPPTVSTSIAASIALVIVVALVMMMIGTQDAAPRMRRDKGN